MPAGVQKQPPTRRRQQGMALASQRASSYHRMMSETTEPKALRRGWTTGACAAGASRAAFANLHAGGFPDPVPVALPNGMRPEFSLAMTASGEGWSRAGIVKDAGDDPDVTHGALIVATVKPGAAGGGIGFHAGEGVGTVTLPGLPLAVGEPAINPAPREMTRANIAEVAALLGVGAAADVTISVPGGEKIAERTLNARLGIVGGLSILGTTGIVVPYSCAAWISSIHRGIDVARAAGCQHIAGATGATSEAAVRARYDLPETALIDMGDFVGGMIKYLRAHPVPRVTIAGGFAKMTKLAQGRLDLHSRRGGVDLVALSLQVAETGGPAFLVDSIAAANTALHALELAASGGVDLAALIARRAWLVAARAFGAAEVALEIIVVSRDGRVLAATGFIPLSSQA
jgi:cobalt-precorrin-5B (C1)-methyltransferase